MWNRTKIDDIKAKRSSARVTIEAIGRLTSDHDVVTCVIEDFSATGARLRLKEHAAAHLFGDGWVLTSAITGSLPIEIRWRNVDHAGVSFSVEQEERAHLNKFVKALIRYGLTQVDFHPTAEHRGKARQHGSEHVGPKAVTPLRPRREKSGSQ